MKKVENRTVDKKVKRRLTYAKKRISSSLLREMAMPWLLETPNKQRDDLTKLPSNYAEEIRNDFIASKRKKDIASLGQYFTPQVIAKLIAGNFSEIISNKTIKILDPGAGVGILSCALCERIASWKNQPVEIELVAYEIDKLLIMALEKVSLILNTGLVNKVFRFRLQL